MVKALDDMAKSAFKSVDTAKRFIQSHATTEHMAKRGITGPFRRDMTESAKVKYIKDHGDTKYLALPW